MVEVEFDELRTVKGEDGDGNDYWILLLAVLQKCALVDEKTGINLATNNVPYGSFIRVRVKNGARLKKGDVICEWDPYNAVIISETAGSITVPAI